MKLSVMLMALIGVSACAGQSATDAGVCIGQRADIAKLRAALDAHPETPSAVGEAAVDVVIGQEAGCGSG